MCSIYIYIYIYIYTYIYERLRAVNILWRGNPKTIGFYTHLNFAVSFHNAYAALLHILTGQLSPESRDGRNV